jgi:hypothetical protein
MPPLSDLDAMLRALEPTLRPGRYAFVALPAGMTIDAVLTVASIREEEGLSAVVGEATARELGLEVHFVAAWITLRVRSGLAAVGLTAAVATQLAERGIAANVVAGTRHDHIFVPFERAAEAMAALADLQRRACAER